MEYEKCGLTTEEVTLIKLHAEELVYLNQKIQEMSHRKKQLRKEMAEVLGWHDILEYLGE